jgi:membrane associated rhomboid family serine protease
LSPLNRIGLAGKPGIEKCSLLVYRVRVDIGPAIIPVRSEAQAMEWSLVLASQGITAVIQRDTGTGRLALEVGSDELRAARVSLRLYLIENRNRRWQTEMAWTGLLFDWRCCFWALYLGLMFYLCETLGDHLRLAGRMDAGAVQHGEWWRLLTATTLHADLTHLTANLATGALLLGFAMGAYGAGAALGAILFAGVIGNVGTLFLIGPPHLSLGASGAVMGALGLLSVHTLATPAKNRPARLLGRSVMGGALLLVLLGLNPQSDVLAHVGGFAGGCLAGALLSLPPARKLSQSRWDGWLAWLAAASLAASWVAALRHVS